MYNRPLCGGPCYIQWAPLGWSKWGFLFGILLDGWLAVGRLVVGLVFPGRDWLEGIVSFVSTPHRQRILDVVGGVLEVGSFFLGVG